MIPRHDLATHEAAHAVLAVEYGGGLLLVTAPPDQSSISTLASNSESKTSRFSSSSPMRPFMGATLRGRDP